MNLRSECWADDGRGLETWREIVWKWRASVEDNRDTWATFENQDGEQATSEMGDRFTSDRWDQRYAKLNDLADGMEEEYGRRLRTVMLSFTASSTDADGNPRPPVDHLLDLEESKDAITSALHRVLDGRRWERVALPEQHKSGYIHWHWAIFVDGDVSPEDFQPVIDSHLNNCSTAGADAHRILPDQPKRSAVSVREDGESLPAYLLAYTMGDGDEYGHDPLEAPEERQMMLALLWATNKRFWRPGDGAQKYMTLEADPVEDDWQLLGIRDGRDGELHEIEAAAGGVTMFETLETDLRPDPPPRAGS